MEFQRLVSSMHPVLMLAILVTVFLASLLAQWIMPRLSVFNHLPSSLTDKLTHSPCSERTLKPKHESETSSFVFRRYATQPISEDPFSAFDNSFTRNHEELAAFGSWARCHDSALQYGNALRYRG
jgi:hypothetical protein